MTPTNVIGLRKIINETTMDIMYYTSSYFRNEVREIKNYTSHQCVLVLVICSLLVYKEFHLTENSQLKDQMKTNVTTMVSV